MLLENLKTVVRAAQAALEESTGLEVTPDSIHQVEECEFKFAQVAAVHYREGPLRRIVLGCDEELGRAIAARHSSADQQDNQDHAAEAVRGFELLCGYLRDALVVAVREEEMRRDFVIHDPVKFRARAASVRQFHVVLDTDAGQIQMLCSLATQSDLEGRPPDTYDHSLATTSTKLSGYSIELPEDVKNIINGLVHREGDVYLRLPLGDGRHEVRQATILDFAKDNSQRALAATSSLMAERDLCEGDELTVMFFRRGRLLQFECSFVVKTAHYLMPSLKLPVMHFSLPEKITPGQRRGAFRIVPDTEVTGKIRSSLILRETRSGEKRQVVPFVMRDLSFTGARVEITSYTLLSGFRWGREVVCTMDLPQPHGAVELVAIVHRLDLLPKRKPVSNVQLGIEFVRDCKETSSDLEKIRRYVLDQERQTLRRRTELVGR